jgi:hypothetical protein
VIDELDVAQSEAVVVYLKVFPGNWPAVTAVNNEISRLIGFATEGSEFMSVRGPILSHLHVLRTVYGAHLASYPLGNVGFVLGDIAAAA